MTQRIYISGMVQGVGMRPFIALLAHEFGVAGTVKNVGSNVEIIASADEAILDAFVAAIGERKPEMAEITKISQTQHIDPFLAGAGFHTHPGTESCNGAGFHILPSTSGGVAMLPADFPVCKDCISEFSDKTNRRFRHPFISCAVCGPRYSILQRAPYDRGTTSMADFPMCPECAREYADPKDRRYHAQTVSCHQCGPYLIYQDGNHSCEREDALKVAADRLKSGGIVAVKGVGGYHLACSPHNELAVRRLRALKGRELKPFAVMFRDIDDIEECCEVSPQERELLLSPARPIVLLATKGSPFAPAVNGDAMLTGCFLPYTAMQLLLLEECGPLVMTSANRSGKPEIHEDGEMLAMLACEELNGVLYHSRRIVTRLDDSVARVNSGQRQLIRRARGYAPRPVHFVPEPFHGAGMEPRPYRECRNILAYGSDLKSAFCMLRGSDAYMSQYFGDMEELEVQQAYEANLMHMGRLFTFQPEVAACDMHPGYHASRLAQASGLPLVEVQHHHAHVASVMAEQGLTGPVIGLAFDGTGYGTDGAIWGGEFLLCQGGEFERKAHLRYVTLAGGDSVAVDARKAELCYCEAAGAAYEGFEGAALLRAALAGGVNTARYSGMGRLFDAVSCLLGLCQTNDYEGRCAVALENAANRALARGAAPALMDFEIIESGDTMEIDICPVIRRVAEAGWDAADAEAAALGFHEALCRMALEVCKHIRAATGAGDVALSGGTFQNGLILSGCIRLLTGAGFRVYTNNEVPCNDGGLALGQAFIAVKRMEKP